MLQVHHLNDSRSQRILWLLEELGIEYEIVHHKRNPETFLAPDSLLAVHPLGKAPVLCDGELRIHESGAIIEYAIDRYGDGRLRPKPGTPERVRYLVWMHYAEGSAALPLIMRLYLNRLGEAAAPLEPRVTSEIRNHLGYLDAELGSSEFFAGPELTGADIQLSFVIQLGSVLHGLSEFPNLERFIHAVQKRPAYLRAMEKGGPSMFQA